MKKLLDRTPTAQAFITAKLLHCSFIMLGHGFFALIDHSEKRLEEFTWHRTTRGYAGRLKHERGRNSDRLIYLHRQVMVAHRGDVLDHVNMNKLDCRKTNLRLASVSENGANREKPKKKGATSIFKGVCWDSSKAKWLAQSRRFGIMKFIGRFDCEIEAAKAYNTWAKNHFGEFARLNAIK